MKRSSAWNKCVKCITVFFKRTIILCICFLNQAHLPLPLPHPTPSHRVLPPFWFSEFWVFGVLNIRSFDPSEFWVFGVLNLRSFGFFGVLTLRSFDPSEFCTVTGSPSHYFSRSLLHGRALHELFLKKGVPYQFSSGWEIFSKVPASWENLRNTSLKNSYMVHKIRNTTLFMRKIVFYNN